MFNDILIHPRTKSLLTDVVKRGSHGILLAGEQGAGKKFLGLNLSAQLLGLNDTNEVQKYPYFVCIDPEDSSITIESVRAISKLMTLKTPSSKEGIQRLVLIVDADRMKVEAQNALLKTLEEPPEDTCIILTSHAAKSLLPTITSRVQTVDVLPLSDATLTDYFKGKSDNQIKSAHALSRGNASLLYALLNEEEHELKNGVTEAKTLLASPIGQRLAQVDVLSKDKKAVQRLCDAFLRISHAALLKASSDNKTKQAEKWHSNLRSTEKAIKALKQNANTKLVLDELFLNL